MTEYEQGKARLVHFVRQHCKPVNLTAYGRQLKGMATRLDDLRRDLGGPEWLWLEIAYNEIEDAGSATFDQVIASIKDLADKARQLATELPKPQARPATRYAAEGFVALRHWHRMPMPSLYTQGPDVAELAQICEQAGVPRDAETVRGALSAAMNAYRPHHLGRPWVYRILTGRSV